VIQNLFTGKIPQKQATPIFLGGNYARSSQWFEPGFSGFYMMRWRS
jgi:hypothetical protein